MKNFKGAFWAKNFLENFFKGPFLELTFSLLVFFLGNFGGLETRVGILSQN